MEHTSYPHPYFHLQNLEERRQPQEEKELPGTRGDIVNKFGIGTQEQLDTIDPGQSSSNRNVASADIVNRKPKRFATESLPLSPTLRGKLASISVFILD